jgi:prevent-host-death family protein
LFHLALSTALNSLSSGVREIALSFPLKMRPVSGRRAVAAGSEWHACCESRMIHGMVTATIRDLRTRFPRLKELVAREGEVIVTDRGRPAFVLRSYEAPRTKKPTKVDYYRRLRAHPTFMITGHVPFVGGGQRPEARCPSRCSAAPSS